MEHCSQRAWAGGAQLVCRSQPPARQEPSRSPSPPHRPHTNELAPNMEHAKAPRLRAHAVGGRWAIGPQAERCCMATRDSERYNARRVAIVAMIFARSSAPGRSPERVTRTVASFVDLSYFAQPAFRSEARSAGVSRIWPKPH